MPDPSPSKSRPALPFRATLRPHRSLGRAGFLVLMLALTITSAISGALFTVLGAWPIAVLFALDVLLVYVAFRINYRDGRRCETIDITSASVVLTRYEPDGSSRYKDFNPAWVRVDLDEKPDGRTTLALSVRGDRTAFGGFLTDDERRDVAELLRPALLEARGGVRI